MSLMSPFEPTCYSIVAKFPKWRITMEAELNALLKNNTGSLILSSRAHNIVGCIWVFRIKRSAVGTIECYKARLVAKGFHQQAGIDFSETFSPIVKPTSIRVVLSLAVSAGWSMRQIDIQIAFLHSNLSEEVYVLQPLGFHHPSLPNHICKLNKAIYVLKQEPCAWFSLLSGKLLEFGFIASRVDSSLFTFLSNSLTMYVLIYVDDIIITNLNHLAIDDLLNLLQWDFAVKDLGELNFFHNVEVLKYPNDVLLSQRHYIIDLLNCTNMLRAKPISSPMSNAKPLSAFDGAIFPDLTLFRSTIGSLQYLSITRPDLSFAINRVCQFMHRPTTTHWQVVKRILRYLKHTISHGLLLKRFASTHPGAFSDADWARCPDDVH